MRDFEFKNCNYYRGGKCRVSDNELDCNVCCALCEDHCSDSCNITVGSELNE